ncbi:SDR family NAD(P)-dependent oxidoreductase [Streptomyces sp. 8L]|uniref:SDR family NAD(P)-dependent oxidoreductase n=1 Tax=Streptomyces sp. 8L TaxID=2877242 RepID=UPI001CD4C67A|nr:SDR family NAD(P)-dependent oxidoreductase [Streptomyces sp. 8L]MCA1221021.1 SDR family NAD(P)-dependent oxidoreductase [Streptomyces sp. 8L]
MILSSRQAPPTSAALEGFRYVFERNFFGDIALIKAILRHVRASRERLIVATSANGLVGAPFNDAYASSEFTLKRAVESLGRVSSPGQL